VDGVVQLADPAILAESGGGGAARLLELRPLDDELAHEVQQVVELGEVHAHEVGARGDDVGGDGEGGFLGGGGGTGGDLARGGGDGGRLV
jgi:hypothetical protein